MQVFIIYAHPSKGSFTYNVLNEFVKGLRDAGHSYEIADLYEMNFNSEMSESEYIREANYRMDLSVPSDVIGQQKKINTSDALVFIYPVFWTEAPTKLVGWFDRVWTYGFAYGEKTMKKLKKALILCVAGRTTEHLMQYGHYQSMENIMLGDRLFDRAEESKMIVLDGMSKANVEQRTENWNKHLITAYSEGLKF